MNLIGAQDVDTTSYKRAAVIMLNNTGAVPEMQMYEDTVFHWGMQCLHSVQDNTQYLTILILVSH